MYKRLLASQLRRSAKSVLLLGPRQTGKSTLIKNLLPDLSINLASEPVFLDYSAQPDLLEKVIDLEKPKTIFIDEVQRIPSLLKTVQAILDGSSRTHRFFLTGSSARKLRRGNANLLPGRVVSYQLRPLSAEELGKDLVLEQALVYGTLPGVVSEKTDQPKKELLRTYGATYLVKY